MPKPFVWYAAMTLSFAKYMVLVLFAGASMIAAASGMALSRNDG